MYITIFKAFQYSKIKLHEVTKLHEDRFAPRVNYAREK